MFIVISLMCAGVFIRSAWSRHITVRPIVSTLTCASFSLFISPIHEAREPPEVMISSTRRICFPATSDEFTTLKASTILSERLSGVSVA